MEYVRRFRVLMEEKLSSEAEDYLEAIYKLQSRKGIARTTELATELNVVPGSVTNTIRHLEMHGLVKREPYKGVVLTAEGKKKALRILRRHRLAERLLADVLGASWIDIHNNACRLEHALTGEVTELLDKRLGYPRFCPHGNPIPTEDGAIEEEESLLLTEAEMNKTYVVAKVIDESRKKLSVLATEGILPGIRIRLLERDSSDMLVDSNGRRCRLDFHVASAVFVREVEDV